MIGKILVGIVIFGFVGIILVCMLYDILRCKHEWEQKTYSAIDYTSLTKVTKVCLICKKCGKIKVIK